MGSSSMKVHSFARGFWDNTHQMSHEPQPLTLGCKRFRPLAPKVSTTGSSNVVNGSPNFDLKSFIKPESGPRKLVSSPSNHHQKKDSPSHQVESQCHPGGTRWNPTQEQIGILEMLYKGGMRTPNAQQIEQITEQLSKYGKIEGKNVFYWFQNHKARERQKQKRTILGLTHNPRNWTPSSTTPLITSTTLTLDTRVELDHEQQQQQQMSPYKRKFRSWTFECVENNNLKKGHIDDDDEEHKVENKILELFPLRPERS